MKTLLLFTFLFVSSLLFHAQDEVVGPPPGTGQGTDVICNRFCFTNTTNCIITISVRTNDGEDPCMEGLFPDQRNITLGAGESGCVELKSMVTGCALCPGTYTITVCGSDTQHCFTFSNDEAGGYGIIKCDDAFETVSWYHTNPRNYVIVP